MDNSDNITATNILLVEDDTVSQKAMKHFFKTRGYSFDIASTGEQAIDLATKKSYHVILLDCELPGIKGYEVSDILSQKLQADKPPIIIITAYADEDTLQLFHKRGIDLILQKPVKNTFLGELIETLIPRVKTGNTQTLPVLNLSPDLLIVEDDTVIQQLYKAMLRKMEITIVLANNGQEGIDIAMKQAFGLILTDINMPIMDGYAFAQYVKEHDGPNKQTPIIAVTALDSAESIRRSKESGIQDILVKPFNIEMLTKLLKKWMPEHFTKERKKRIDLGNTKTNPGTTQNTTHYSTKNLINKWKNTNVFAPGIISELLETLQDSGLELIESLLNEFKISFPQAIQQIKQCVSDDHFEEAKKVAHMYKSRAGSLGFLRLQTVFEHVQTVLSVNDATTMPEALEILTASFEPSLKALVEAFPQFSKQEKPETLLNLESAMKYAKVLDSHSLEILTVLMADKEPEFIESLRAAWDGTTKEILEKCLTSKDFAANRDLFLRLKALAFSFGAMKLHYAIEILLCTSTVTNLQSCFNEYFQLTIQLIKQTKAEIAKA